MVYNINGLRFKLSLPSSCINSIIATAKVLHNKFFEALAMLLFLVNKSLIIQVLNSVAQITSLVDRFLFGLLALNLLSDLVTTF